MIFAEVPEREAVQVPFVRWVAERAEIGVMRSHDEDAAAGLEEAVKFFDRAHYVGHMFDHVNSPDLAKGRVFEREREVVEIGNHIRIRVDVPIDSDCPWIFLD